MSAPITNKRNADLPCDSEPKRTKIDQKRQPLDEHQFIPIFEITSPAYHYATCFPKQARRISHVFTPFIESLPTCFFTLENNPNRHPYDGWAIEDIPTLIERNDAKWNIRSISTGRTKAGEHPDLPEFFFKFYNVRPGKAQPLAHVLRVPMSHRLKAVAYEEKMEDEVEVVLKGYVPLTSTEIIKDLDENTMNEALVVIAEKKKLIPSQEMISLVKGLPESTQKRRANQLCLFPARTGIGDFTWKNLQMTVAHKIAVIDTEPLYCELMPKPEGEHFATKFPKNATWLKPALAPASTFRKCALFGLTNFQKSSEEHELSVFAETAQRYIDNLSPAS